MGEDDIQELEGAIDKKLPDFYRKFLIDYPDDLVRLGSPYNTVSELSLPNTAKRLIEINELENPPKDILVIGVDGLGNFYYIILNNSDNKIYLFNHEEQTFLDGKSDQIDYGKSWSFVFQNLDELIKELREQFYK